MTTNKAKKLLLIDAIGAIFSSIIIILGIFCIHDILGMPKKILIILAIIPVFYFIYSLTHSIRSNKIKKLSNQLKTIAFANLSYSALTFTLLLYYSSKLSVLELIYFILEIIILIILSIIEFKIAQKLTN